MELGFGFAFVGWEYRMKVGNTEPGGLVFLD
jgi:hypothetical protein